MVSVARNIRTRIILCDLINEGNVGLVRAATADEKKNLTISMRFADTSGYSAVLGGAVQNNETSTNRAGAIHKISKTQIELEQRYSRAPDISEIAQELKLSENAVQETINISNSHVSLDAPLKDIDGSTLLDMIQQNEGHGTDEGMHAISP